MLRKLIDDPNFDGELITPCMVPGHNFPNNMVLQPGRWEWTCQSCGKKTIVNVPAVYCTSIDGQNEGGK